MNLLPALAALLLGGAAFSGHGTGASLGVTRVLAALGALALLPGMGEPASWPGAALAAGAVALATPLPCLLAAGGAAHLYLRPAVTAEPSGALALAGFAAALAAGGLSAEARARLSGGAGAAGAAAAGGAALCLSLATLDGGRVLRWAFGLGSGPARLELPGAGFLLGLTLLASWAGTVSLAAHLLAPSVVGARTLGQRLLILAGGLASLGIGFILFQGLGQGPEALAESATGVVGCSLAAGLLVLGLKALLESPGAVDPSPRETSAGLTGRLATLLALLAVAAAGGEGWLRQGTYATPFVSAAVAAGLLGLAALEPARLVLTRRAAFLASLVFLLV
jgi:hypothetical protein